MSARNPSGIEIIPGVVYGNIASPTKIAFPATGFQTFGLNATRTIADTSPTIIPEIAPVVLKRFQYIVNKITGRFALAQLQMLMILKMLRLMFGQIMQV